MTQIDKTIFLLREENKRINTTLALLLKEKEEIERVINIVEAVEKGEWATQPGIKWLFSNLEPLVKEDKKLSKPKRKRLEVRQFSEDSDWYIGYYKIPNSRRNWSKFPEVLSFCVLDSRPTEELATTEKYKIIESQKALYI